MSTRMRKITKPAESEVSVSDLPKIHDIPEYAEAFSKLCDLRERQKQAAEDARAIELRFTAGQIVNVVPDTKAESLRSAALAEIGDGNGSDGRSYHQVISEARHKTAVLAEAVNIQESRVSSLARELTRSHSGPWVQMHLNRVERVLLAVRELCSAIEDEVQLRCVAFPDSGFTSAAVARGSSLYNSQRLHVPKATSAVSEAYVREALVRFPELANRV